MQGASLSDPDNLQAYLRTPDGRYIVVRERVWRTSNPNLEPNVREYWVSELMSARRAVREVQQNKKLLKQVRARVDRAKRALGERDPVWWEDGEPDFNRRLIIHTPYAAWFLQAVAEQAETRVADRMIAKQLLYLLATRAPQSSACPSEVARSIAAANENGWYSLMPQIREVVRALMHKEQVRVTRGKQNLLDDEFAGGPIRIRRGPKFGSPEG